MNTERRSKTKRGILVAIILVALIATIGGTYARYSSTGKAQTNIQAAKWQVKIGEDDISTQTKTITVPLTVTGTENVATDRIAPAVTATGEIELDLTDTEVAVDVTADAIVADITPDSFASKNKITASTEIEGATNGVISLVNNSAFTSTNGKKKITVTVQWENDDKNNVNDTSAGNTAETITIPVEITVKQHIPTTNP